MADETNRFLVERPRLALQQRRLPDALRVLNDDETHDGGDSSAANTVSTLDVFRGHFNAAVLALRDAGNDDQQIYQNLRRLAVQALLETVHVLSDQIERLASQAGFIIDGGGGGGDVPAPAAALHSLENDDGATECSICLVEFVDGELVGVLPCPSHGHKFHPDCITRWLQIRNTCPLCRHELIPTADAYDQ